MLTILWNQGWVPVRRPTADKADRSGALNREAEKTLAMIIEEEDRDLTEILSVLTQLDCFRN